MSTDRQILDIRHSFQFLSLGADKTQGRRSLLLPRTTTNGEQLRDILFTLIKEGRRLINLNLYQPSFRRLLGRHHSASLFTPGTLDRLAPRKRPPFRAGSFTLRVSLCRFTPRETYKTHFLHPTVCVTKAKVSASPSEEIRIGRLWCRGHCHWGHIIRQNGPVRRGCCSSCQKEGGPQRSTEEHTGSSQECEGGDPRLALGNKGSTCPERQKEDRFSGLTEPRRGP